MLDTPALTAFATFRQQTRRMRPTRKHRPVLWECMLATVYAMDPQGRVEYFDYDYDRAIAHIGPVSDLRVSRLPRGIGLRDRSLPKGQLVWFGVDKPA